MNNTEFEIKLNEYRNILETSLTKRTDQPGYKNNRVCDAIKYSLLGGGKRVRGVLTLAFCDALSGTYEQAVDFACAAEMVHCYSLIHDDLPCMDNDDYRRGKLSCHKKFGEATAVLAGDGLLTLAFETMVHSCKVFDDMELALEGIGIMSSSAGVLGMIGGQIADIQNENRNMSFNELLVMQDKKTGALIKASCCLGIVAAGGDVEKFALAGEYGTALGLAFQITDDILDVTSDKETLGKAVNKDKARGKFNFVSEMGVEEAKKTAEGLTGEAIKTLGRLENSEFLIMFTKSLLERQN
ncbi:MAG: polyprenyl synthetase family protein [Oscillospiraceae bacterium]|nr:polyprenyl synthetase family protein [Oscillospiraceae bacterium]